MPGNLNPSRKIRSLGRLVRHSSNVVWNDVRANWLGQRFPLKPTTINLLVNDICNSKCQMCFIWKQKRDHELTPDELARILQDPLFQRIKYVGVSGGEPTMRKDLPQIFRVLAERQPRIKGAGIITNAIQPREVIARVEASADHCLNAGVAFNLMVSLDGVGPVHDRIRGREGNFDRAMQVIDHFRNHSELAVSFGCTITKDNVWHVDDLLDFARREGLYGRFRVAEFINRLYNADAQAVIRNFSPLEAYHLGLFFTKLEREFETNANFKNTYRNLRAMLTQGKKRTIKCPYQSKAIVLDCRGQMLYCSPKSPIIGSALASSGQRLYRDGLDLRRQILVNDCQDCIHDYHDLPTTRDLIQRGTIYLRRRALQVPSAVRKSKRISQPNHVIPAQKGGRAALIVGWYGTETAGDKAILAELVHQLHRQGVTRITVASLHPFLTEWTVNEIGYPEIEIIPTHSAHLLAAAARADETIMGGGPLMDLAALGPVLHAFIAASQAGKQTRIAGCGIGPLNQPRYIQAVSELLRIATRVELRDTQSVRWASETTGRTDIVLSGDPAAAYVRRWVGEQPAPPAPAAWLNCYFREWPLEYRGNLSTQSYQLEKERFESQLAEWVTHLCERYALRPRLLAMHHFVIGGDDREFNRIFSRRYLTHLDPVVEIQPFSLEEILQSFRSASLCLTMRFHSALFAHTLEAPYYAIDYTQGGKVQGFLRDQDALPSLVTIQEIASGEWRNHAALPVKR